MFGNGVSALVAMAAVVIGILGAGFGAASWLNPSHKEIGQLFSSQTEILIGMDKRMAVANAVIDRIDKHFATANELAVKHNAVMQTLSDILGARRDDHQNIETVLTKQMQTLGLIQSNIADNKAAFERLDAHVVAATRTTEAQTEVLKILIEVLMKQRGDG